LPGLPFPGEPYALPVKDAVARYLDAYVEHFALPVRLNTRVSSLVRNADHFVVTTEGETFTARSVIVATGAYHRAYIPAFASALSPSLAQTHSSEYRNPDSLPPGSVLVVGAGNSGAQIALELAQSGRVTWLSGRDTGSIPRQVLGRDVYDWLWWTVLRLSVDSWMGRRLMGQLFAGDPLVGFSRRALMIPKLTSVSRTVGFSNGHPRLEDGRVLEDVRTVVWCTGFRPDFRWIQLPVFGPDGYPEHRRGIVAAAPGLGFVGLRHKYRIGSSLIGSVREDAKYVVRQQVAHDSRRSAAFRDRVVRCQAPQIVVRLRAPTTVHVGHTDSRRAATAHSVHARIRSPLPRVSSRTTAAPARSRSAAVNPSDSKSMLVPRRANCIADPLTLTNHSGTSAWITRSSAERYASTCSFAGRAPRGTCAGIRESVPPGAQ